MRYEPVPNQLFADRRQAFLRKMKPGTVAIFLSNDVMLRSADQHFPFRQHSDLLRLTGIEQHGTVLVLDKSAPKDGQREMLFILPRDPMQELWHGSRLTPKAAGRISGIDAVYPVARADKWLPDLLRDVDTVYCNRAPDDREAPAGSPALRQLRAWMNQSDMSRLRSTDAIMQPLAMVKHRIEVDQIRTAVNVTEGAFLRVLETLQPGMYEYEVEAEITHHFTACGCPHAYDPIIAAGASACILHYTSNDRVIKPDSLVLLDFGASYAHLSADLSRTLPASGRFTPRQRDLYLAVLRILQKTTDLMRPGMTLPELNREAGRFFDDELVRLKLATRTEIRRQDKRNPIRKRYFMHGIGHHLGYDVHDLSDRDTPFKPGMVITCEPGLYIPKEKTGIRLENDIRITRGAPENLMAHVPIDPDEIELLMQQAMGWPLRP